MQEKMGHTEIFKVFFLFFSFFVLFLVFYPKNKTKQNHRIVTIYLRIDEILKLICKFLFYLF